MRKPSPKRFADQLRDYREQVGGISMAEAARRFKIPYRTWQAWELGQREPRGIARRLLLELLNRSC